LLQLAASLKHKTQKNSKRQYQPKPFLCMTPQNQNPQSTEDADAEYQRQEAIRLANQGAGGEATPPDISPVPHRTGSPTSDENFDGTRYPYEGRSLEDRDTNDGDANTENG
jgi:hypothetical protein